MPIMNSWEADRAMLAKSWNVPLESVTFDDVEAFRRTPTGFSMEEMENQALNDRIQLQHTIPNGRIAIRKSAKKCSIPGQLYENDPGCEGALTQSERE